jgi:hypothetical protein
MSSVARNGHTNDQESKPVRGSSSLYSSSLYAGSIFVFLVSVVAFYYIKMLPPVDHVLSAIETQGKGGMLDWVKPGDTSGEFKRQVSSFRNWIEKGSDKEFAAEKGRYHLYVSYACPWGESIQSYGLGGDVY